MRYGTIEWHQNDVAVKSKAYELAKLGLEQSIYISDEAVDALYNIKNARDMAIQDYERAVEKEKEEAKVKCGM